jgi:hypothetical protein
MHLSVFAIMWLSATAAILRDPYFTGMCIKPAAGLQYAKCRLIEGP